MDERARPFKAQWRSSALRRFSHRRSAGWAMDWQTGTAWFGWVTMCSPRFSPSVMLRHAKSAHALPVSRAPCPVVCSLASILFPAALMALAEPLPDHPPLLRQPILFVVRHQYRPDHHNTATFFPSARHEYNDGAFTPGGALKVFDLARRRTDHDPAGSGRRRDSRPGSAFRRGARLCSRCAGTRPTATTSMKSALTAAA